MNEQIKLFSVVKCLDFPGNEDYFMTGTVVEINEDMMKVKGFVKTNAKKEVIDTDDYFMVPIQGVHFLDEKFPGRITVIA